jgi:diguanylate cyclase (GGDEF)-like protein
MTAGYTPTVVFAMVSLERTITARFAEKLSLKGFRVLDKSENRADHFSTPILSRSGKPVAFLVWTASEQFQHLLGRMLPSIAGLTLISIFLVFWYLRKIGKLQRIIAAQEAEARHLAFHDALTGLPNRARFNEIIREALASAGVKKPCFIGFLDLDYFKQVNDDYGHDVGDALIQAVGSRMRGALCDTIHIARLGGDEFAFVAPSLGSEQEVRACCETLIAAIMRPFRAGGVIIHPSASLGISQCPKDGTEVKEVLKSADLALYAAKANGRGCFAIHGKKEPPAATPLAAE